MLLSKMKILAIAPITKRLGVAVFENAELIYFAIATVRSNKIAQSLKVKISQTIRNLINEIEPDLVVVKKINKQQEKSKNLKLVIRQIESECGRARIRIRGISFEMVKELLCVNNKKNKTTAFINLTDVYTELRRFLHQPNKWQKEYYDALLSAVAIGFYYQSEIGKQEIRQKSE